jgi:hypothetical protein
VGELVALLVDGILKHTFRDRDVNDEVAFGEFDAASGSHVATESWALGGCSVVLLVGIGSGLVRSSKGLGVGLLVGLWGNGGRWATVCGLLGWIVLGLLVLLVLRVRIVNRLLLGLLLPVGMGLGIHPRVRVIGRIIRHEEKAF